MVREKRGKDSSDDLDFEDEEATTTEESSNRGIPIIHGTNIIYKDEDCSCGVCEDCLASEDGEDEEYENALFKTAMVGLFTLVIVVTLVYAVLEDRGIIRWVP